MYRRGQHAWMLAARQRCGGLWRALVDLVPSYTTLMVHYDLPGQAGPDQPELRAGTRRGAPWLPVWYDPASGRTGLLPQRASGRGDPRHSSAEYRCLGFAPGFAFMGLVENLATPAEPPNGGGGA
nr:carboxyltransferase domain-containing protein [Pseudomonas peli]